MDRRLIEETFPIKEIGNESVYEKRQRIGHPSGIHPWWARRPLAASIATIYLSLVDFKNEKNAKSKIEKAIEISKWSNFRIYENMEKIQKDFMKGKIRPKILDPFSGSGMIPLQAFRLGCDTYATDYNPVSNVILKCGIEYINKNSIKIDKTKFADVDAPKKIKKDFLKWSNWVFKQLEKEVGSFFSNSTKDTTNVIYVWAQTITCQNPSCKAKIPMLNSFLLKNSKKNKQKIFLYPIRIENSIKFKIIDSLKESIPKGFDPDKGNISRGKVMCLVCNTGIDAKQTKAQFVNGDSNETMVCVISVRKGEQGKKYKIPSDEDISNFKSAEKFLEKMIVDFEGESHIDLIPNEPLPENASHRGSGGVLRLYGFKTYGELFNKRQLSVLIVIVEKIKECMKMIHDETNSEQQSMIIGSYLSLVLGSLLNYYSKFARLNVTEGRGVANTFGRPTLGMVYTYAESNPLNSVAASWIKISKDLSTYLETDLQSDADIVTKMCSAVSLPFPDEFFDGVFTDPPYYDNIPYANLSDFFYVWLKRTMGNIFPDLFSTLLTPKSDEIISELQFSADKRISKKNLKDSIYFESMLSKAFKEIFRVLKRDGISIIVYAHKSTLGWETMIKSLLNSGLLLTAAWPIHTEMKGRLQAQDTASLASSIYMVCRKLEKQPHETYGNVKKQMKEYLDEKLDFLWEQDIRGADFFIAAIGSATEVFGKYEQITDTSDKEIKVPQLLDDVRKMVSEYAINKVLHGEIGGEISTMTRFYVLWRAAYGQAKVPYDDARKLATSLGIPNDELNKGFIKQEKDVVRVSGPEDRSIEEIKEPTEMIDVLHKVLILWRNSKKDEYEKLLDETGYAKSDTFRRVGQAISESLPDSQEKKMLDGFLNQYSGGEDASDDKQTKLF